MSIDRVIIIAVWFVIGLLAGFVTLMFLNLKKKEKQMDQFDKEFSKAIQEHVARTQQIIDSIESVKIVRIPESMQEVQTVDFDSTAWVQRIEEARKFGINPIDETKEEEK